MSHKVRRVAPKCLTRSLVKTVFQSIQTSKLCFLAGFEFVCTAHGTSLETMGLCRSEVGGGNG